MTDGQLTTFCNIIQHRTHLNQQIFLLKLKILIKNKNQLHFKQVFRRVPIGASNSQKKTIILTNIQLPGMRKA